VSGLLGFLTQIPGAIVGVFSGAGSWLYNSGRNLVIGMWNGIASLGGWLYSRLMSFARAMIPAPIRRALGINSPSKVTTELGQFVGQGLASGMDKSRTGVSRASARLAAAATPAVGTNSLAPATGGAASGAPAMDMGGLADAIVAGIQRANIGVHIDRKQIGQVVSGEVGKLTDLRRRTG
jgi:hypothetical protein